MPINKIDKILAPSPLSGDTLQKLLINGEERGRLTRVLKHSFPEYLSDGVRQVKKSGTTLYVECRNSSIATKIRFESDSLKQSLSCLSDFEKIDEKDKEDLDDLKPGPLDETNSSESNILSLVYNHGILDRFLYGGDR